MFDKIKALFEFSSKNGLYLPSAFDNRSGMGSVSLLFAHVANALALVAIGIALNTDLKLGVLCAIGYSGLMLVFYLLRSISKFKVDVDDGELEVDSGEPEKEEK